MHLKSVRVAARTAAFGGVLVLGLGCAQAAMAQPVYRVSCNADALNDAINDASSGATLLLAPGCTYYLPAGLTDDIDTLTIIGDGATLEGGGSHSDFTILTVDCMDTLTLDGVNFTEGSDEYGGAIYNGGDLTVNGGIFSHNSAEYGGAIDSYGDDSLTINDAVFTNNEGEYGGAIYAESDCTTITGAHFSENKAYDGGALYAQDDVTVADGSFTGNTAVEGGAIINSADLVLTNVTGLAGSGNAFTGNQATWGGAIYNTDWVGGGGYSLIVFNAAHDVGGGIYNACSASLALSGSTIFGNVTDNIYYDTDC
jgi:predicted outer membrane repeat protein